MKKKDQLSAFLAEELLYDHLLGELEPAREEAMQEYLKANPSVQAKFEYLKRSQGQLKSLEDFPVPKEWIENLSLPDPSLAQQLVSLEKKLAPRFWRTFPYAVLGVAVILGVVIGKPWKLLSFKDVEVAQVSLVDDPYLKDHVPEIEEETPAASIQGEVRETKVKTADNKSSLPPVLSTTPPASTPAKKTTGVLYRSSLTVANLQLTTAQTIEKISELGGRKAGQVELGWERDEDERYFHFSLPESNKEDLVKFLSGFGPVRISSQDHPLVMPQGKIRIILIVKGQSSSPSQPSEEESDAAEETSKSAIEDEEAQ